MRFLPAFPTPTLRRSGDRLPARELAPRWRHFAVWALLCTLISLGLWQSNWRWSAFLDNTALDASFSLRGAYSPAIVAGGLPQSRDIVIVELRHDTPRDVLARLLPKLKMARAVGFDLMFSDRAAVLTRDELPLYRHEIERWNQQDAALARAHEDVGNVVLGAWSEPESPGSVGVSSIKMRWNFPAATLARGTATSHLGVVPDTQDGIIRRVRLFETIEGRPVPAFALALTSRARGISARQLVDAEGIGPARDSALIVDYLGPRAVWEYDTNRIVFERALDAEPEDFAGKIVIVGQTNYLSKDIFPTPFGDMPGLFIHANLVATLLDESHPPRPLAPVVVGAISLVMALVLVSTLARFPVWMCAPVAVLEMAVTLMLAASFFAAWKLILPFSVPVVALLLTYNGIALYEYWRARRTLGRVVGHEVSAQLLDTLSPPHLGGKLQVATAFFCDLRGYSAFSQQLPPEELIALLNLYTASVVREVLAHGGRPIDFFGDGVFVLFEPSPTKNHALQAMRAAIATQNAIAEQMQLLQSATELDPNLHAAASVPLVAGIALHTGPMVIGLVGALEHMKPGAVGDAVNVAARLQGLSETCGFSILLSRATLEFAALEENQSAIEATFCGQFPIKGRHGELDVFGISSSALSDAPVED